MGNRPSTGSGRTVAGETFALQNLVRLGHPQIGIDEVHERRLEYAVEFDLYVHIAIRSLLRFWSSS